MRLLGIALLVALVGCEPETNSKVKPGATTTAASARGKLPGMHGKPKKRPEKPPKVVKTEVGFDALRIPTQQGRYAVSFKYGDRARRMLVQLPRGYSQGRKYPLIITLHGGGQSAMKHVKAARGYAARARTSNVIFIAPQAAGPKGNAGSWNAWSKEKKEGVDDVAFLADLIGWAQKELGAKADEVFMSGFSNGAAMTQRFAAERPNLLAAAAAIGHGTRREKAGETHKLPTPTGPVNMLIVRGGADDTITADGSKGKRGLVVDTPEEQRGFWRDALQCGDEADASKDTTNMKWHRWNSCQEGKALWTFLSARLTHRWPVAPRDDLDGTKLVWKFFFKRRK